jgi:hypothetical protein
MPAGAVIDGRTPRQVRRDLREREKWKHWKHVVEAARAFRHNQRGYLTLERAVDMLELWERRGRPVDP